MGLFDKFKEIFSRKKQLALPESSEETIKKDDTWRKSLEYIQNTPSIEPSIEENIEEFIKQYKDLTEKGVTTEKVYKSFIRILLFMIFKNETLLNSFNNAFASFCLFKYSSLVILSVRSK